MGFLAWPSTMFPCSTHNETKEIGAIGGFRIQLHRAFFEGKQATSEIVVGNALYEAELSSENSCAGVDSIALDETKPVALTLPQIEAMLGKAREKKVLPHIVLGLFAGWNAATGDRTDWWRRWNGLEFH